MKAYGDRCGLIRTKPVLQLTHFVWHGRRQVVVFARIVTDVEQTRQLVWVTVILVGLLGLGSTAVNDMGVACWIRSALVPKIIRWSMPHGAFFENELVITIANSLAISIIFAIPPM